jgi:hypothetical protein
MEVTPRVLNNVAMYIQWCDALRRANQLEDQLNAMTPHMTRSERQAYSQITGMHSIGVGDEVEVVEATFHHGRQDVYPPPPPPWERGITRTD